MMFGTEDSSLQREFLWIQFRLKSGLKLCAASLARIRNQKFVYDGLPIALGSVIVCIGKNCQGIPIWFSLNGAK